jgi:hypothetical protein
LAARKADVAAGMSRWQTRYAINSVYRLLLQSLFERVLAGQSLAASVRLRYRNAR